MGKKRKNILLKYNLFCLVCRLGHKYVKSIVNVESEPESLNSLWSPILVKPVTQELSYGP